MGLAQVLATRSVAEEDTRTVWLWTTAPKTLVLQLPSCPTHNREANSLCQ